MLLPTASPARTALPAAHFDRNATTPVTDLVHQCYANDGRDGVYLSLCPFEAPESEHLKTATCLEGDVATTPGLQCAL
jgi:hypothetical protein